MTPTVKAILDKYEGTPAAVKANLARILMQGRLGGTGKLIILPVDQGFEHGPARSFAVNPPAYDPHYHFQLAIDAGLSAYAAPLGMLEAGADTFAGQIPTILKINSSNSWGTSITRAVTGSVQDAVRLGCAAIGFTIYPGSDGIFDAMDQIAILSAEAREAGLATVIWSYARRQADQGRRTGARRRRLCRAHGGAARRPHHQGEAADRPYRTGRGQEGL